MGSQQTEDALGHGIELLSYYENTWTQWFGRFVYAVCEHLLVGPMQLRDAFNKAGKQAGARGEFLKWYLPITNFPAQQYYMQGTPLKRPIQYYPPSDELRDDGYATNVFDLTLPLDERPVAIPSKQKSGAAPNIVHSLDACHLMLTVNNCDFDVVTVHDSFGCHFCNGDKLFRIVRESFVQLYETDPLSRIAEQIKCDLSGVTFGTYDVHQILDAEYAFA